MIMNLKIGLRVNIQELKDIANLFKERCEVKNHFGYANSGLSPFKQVLSNEIVEFLELNKIEKVWELARYSRSDIFELLNETYIENPPAYEECFYVCETLDLILSMLELSFLPSELDQRTPDREFNSLEVFLFKAKTNDLKY